MGRARVEEGILFSERSRTLCIMYFSRFLQVVLLSFNWTWIHQASCGGETTMESREMKTAGYQVALVVPVTSELTAEVYECVYGADPSDANYTWYRQDLPSLPEGTKAEGNRLHFMHSTSDLNGLYGCIIINERGTAAAFYYREIQDCLFQTILKSVSSLWMLLMQTLSNTVNFRLLKAELKSTAV